MTKHNPDSQLHLTVFTLHHELFVNIHGEPTPDLLAHIEQAARQVRQLLGMLEPPQGSPS